MLYWHSKIIPEGLCKDLAPFLLTVVGLGSDFGKSQSNFERALHPETWEREREFLSTLDTATRLQKSEGQAKL